MKVRITREELLKVYDMFPVRPNFAWQFPNFLELEGEPIEENKPPIELKPKEPDDERERFYGVSKNDDSIATNWSPMKETGPREVVQAGNGIIIGTPMKLRPESQRRMEKLHVQYHWEHEEVFERKINELIDAFNELMEKRV